MTKYNQFLQLFTTGNGISEEVVRTISKLKQEPEWMLDFRLKAFHIFETLPKPKYGPSLEGLNFDAINGSVAKFENQTRPL
ncbi:MULTISPECIES: hypothetical protein [Enterococcus]|uniref:hypothetical protein n=1 Tax=Enterococcus TaxID=1350 RepID=UPI001367A491|nr:MULTISPECIES: hypothetical protein [Enterococcus]MCH5417400.1 hypothetical protein [Enterococcus lactis]NAB58655.1 hypothetical protein [Enterococcus faecium]NRD12489.1 hypothetical protein [Enterococcus faecium]